MDYTRLPADMLGCEGDNNDLEQWSIDISGDNAATDLIMDDAVQLGALPIISQHASPKDWEQHKETIRWLYLDQKHTLTEVMKIMREEFDHDGR